MDPNKTLETLRALTQKLLKDYEDTEGNGIDQDEACELASHFEALDAWLTQGSFLPERWQKKIDEDLFTSIDRILGQNESRCCDDEEDRQQLALALVKGLQQR